MNLVYQEEPEERVKHSVRTYSAKLEELRMIREQVQIEQERAQIQRELDAVLKSNGKWEIFK